MRRSGVKGSALSQPASHGTIVTLLELPYEKPVYEGAVYPSYFDAPADSSYHQVISTGVETWSAKVAGDAGLTISVIRILL
jgi:hypothetical protein